MAAVAVDAAVLVAVEVEVKEEPMARTRPSVCGLALAQEANAVARAADQDQMPLFVILGKFAGAHGGAF